MFSGIIERQGKLIKKASQGKMHVLTFQTKAWDKPMKRGESISVNGVCLTAVGKPQRNRFTVQAVRTTLEQTTLAKLRLRDLVNLERSLKWGERIGGHFVLGHVDGIGRIVRKKLQGKSHVLQIETAPSIIQHLVPKGSVAIDGVSLTIQKLTPRFLSVAIIPHTAKTTTLRSKKQGEEINIEVDVIAKHLARLVRPSRSLSATPQ
jgi:riboflavin synthase